MFFSFKSVNIIMRLRTDLEQKALNMVQIIWVTFTLGRLLTDATALFGSDEVQLDREAKQNG